MKHSKIDPSLEPRKQLATFYMLGYRSEGSRFERRLYQRIWWRIRMSDPSNRAEINAKRRENAARHRIKNRRRCAKWRRENRAWIRKATRKRWNKICRRCAFCRARSTYQNRLKLVERIVPDGKGNWEARKVYWCGC